MKKFLSFAAAAFASLMAAASVSAANAELPFTDVDSSGWYLPYVESVYEKGYMTGVSETLFEPDSGLTRAMYVTVLGRIHGESSKNVPCSFSDVPEDAWYKDYVGWAEKSNIVLGHSDGTFRGDDLISRQELAAMTSRYLELINLTPAASSDAVASFGDSELIDSYAAPHVEKLRSSAILLGDQNGNFNPTDTSTRAEAAAVTVRLDSAVSGTLSVPSITKENLGSYSIYSEYLSEAQKSSLSDIIKEKTDISVPVSAELTDKAIVFDVDDTLRTLEYKVSEKDSRLTVSVSTKFAAPYFDRILRDALSSLDEFIIPVNYSKLGTYEIDAAVDCDEKISFLCETDKNPLAYDLNDKVTFRVTMLCGNRIVSAPAFIYEYANEVNLNNPVNGMVSGISGQFIITVDGASVPGAGKLTASAANRRGQKLAKLGDRNTVITSVIFDFANISTAKEMPEDFNEYWNNRVDALMAVEPKAIKFEKCEVYSDDKYDVYDAWVETTDGMSVSHISVPKNAEPGSLKIQADFDGYGSPRADKADKNPGLITVAVNPHSIDNHESFDYYEEFEKSIEGWGFDDPGYLGGMLMRDIQAIRFAEIQFADLWNGHDIITYGGSMGGFQAAGVAGLYDKVTECVTHITWMCDVGGPNEGRFDGWRTAYNNVSKYYDSCYFISRFNGKLKIGGGLGDYICPPTGLVALYNSANQASKISFSLMHCMEHGGGSGSSYNSSYNISSDNPVPEPIITEIKDNGCAVEVPDYGEDRKLTESEEAMKKSSEEMKKISEDWNNFDDWLEFTFGTSDTMTSEALEARIYEELTGKYSLDSSCRIEIDEDTLQSLKEAHRECTDGSDYSFSLDYTIYDTENGFYDAKVTILVIKDLSL